MSNWNWIGASIEGEFIKDGRTVGLHIQRGGTTSALHFSSIEDRLEARTNQIAEELASLDEWRSGLSGRAADSAGNIDYYRSQTKRLVFERQEIDRLRQEVRSCVPEETAA